MSKVDLDLLKLYMKVETNVRSYDLIFLISRINI